MLLHLRDEVAAALRSALRAADLGSLAEDPDLVEINGPGDPEKGTLASPVAFRGASVAGAPPPQVAERIAAAHGELPDAVAELTVDAGYLNYRLDREAFAAGNLGAILAGADAVGNGAVPVGGTASDESGTGTDGGGGGTGESRQGTGGDGGGTDGSEAGADDPDADAEAPARYGAGGASDPRRTVVEFSSPNVAKPLHIGHVRNTVLGDVLANVLEERGHEVIRDNHLGDWGTQFGNLLAQYHETGDPGALEDRPIEHLLELYQEFGRREADLEDAGRTADLEALRETGREWFRRIEDGDPEAVELFERVREVSIERFEETYDRLGVAFDRWDGEAFYAREGWTDRAVRRVRESGAAIETEDGALVVPIYPGDTEGVGDPATASVDRDTDRARRALAEGEEDAFESFVVVKSDGSTTYGTRDLATIEFRVAELGPDRTLYVVGDEQNDYFRQLFAAARKVGFEDVHLEHVSYGLISLPEGSMSTRRGTMVTAEEVLDRATERARTVVAEREDVSGDDAEAIARKVALATVRFEAAGTSRPKDVVFDVEEATSFEGTTGPYVQYAATRALSILERAGAVPDPGDVDPGRFDDTDHELLFELARYPLVLEECEQKFDSAPLAAYLIDLAQTFNGFYHTNPVLDGDARAERLVLTAATLRVFELGLELMGVDTLERM